MKRIVLASSNPGKLAEIRKVLADTGIELVAQSEFGIADADETGMTFVENALIKARHASRQSGLPALGDDSGICADALGGAPGLYSARYAGEHGNNAANNVKLLDALRGVPDAERGAHFHCTLALLRSADDPAPLIAEGLWYGRILHAAQGGQGFGYDPVFFDPQHGPAGELDPAVKIRFSHRGLALARLRELLDAERR
ncbi:MAG: RdgB/HAM1 family non-canonical purine NTP pyrophosphatase [Rudaea sp.]|uniref:RdgB/HAM1 family non-canonical purine NTP pyrophosphatase n=1 Tax=unclassified Rudaea TaxID=2627037 RepID=UPI0010F9231E|nr:MULTISPECIES: RdgB/HAM1 family non-canonical purine NTP pyrophosphatase [unclassified Rudaea]MBN8887182.1 RdgB/HAM1 family non-canonical purine NTP pyrophosphatase [Rudaea sp.]MBR0346290.1 RdgB/HAM1 family non-canonical purine NTP pyrophosphatase [Rudaea sp.]